MMYIRTKDGIYKVDEVKPYFLDEKQKLFINNELKVAINEQRVINQSENLEELCDEFVFDSDVSSYVIDKKYIEHTKAIILKIYKENDETDYVKAMHPKFYGAIWTSKGLIYVAKMDNEGKLVLI